MAQTLEHMLIRFSGESFDKNESTQAIRQAVEEIVGEDEERKVEEWDCPCGTNHHLETSYHQRNQLRKEQRARLMKFIEGEKL